MTTATQGITWTAPAGTPGGIAGKTFSGGYWIMFRGEPMVDFGVQHVGGKKQSLKVRAAGKPELERLAAEWMAAEKAEKEAEAAAKLKEREDIESGRKPIEVSFHDGEYLSGYQCFGHAASLLIKLGLANEVSYWGCHVETKAVNALGKSFTYQQAVEFARPALEAKAAAELARKAASDAKFSAALDEAKRTGKPQAIRHWSETRRSNCEGEWGDYLFVCSTMVRPDGTTFDTATNTY